MERTLYLCAFPRPLPDRERDAFAAWAERRALIAGETDGSGAGWLGRLTGRSRRQERRARRLAELDALLDDVTIPPPAAFQGPRIGLDPEADLWLVSTVVDSPAFERELRRLLGTPDRPFDGPLGTAACVQRFVGAPLQALEGVSVFASLRYALMYPRMELRLTAQWCRDSFPRQRWIPLQWPQDAWPEDGDVPDWVPPTESGLTVPLLPAVALQFADRFEAELLRALAPLPGLRGVPSRRLRDVSRTVWRYDGEPPQAPRHDDTWIDGLPDATLSVLAFAADLFDQITWVRRWAEAGHPLGLDWCAPEPAPDALAEPERARDAEPAEEQDSINAPVRDDEVTQTATTEHVDPPPDVAGGEGEPQPVSGKDAEVT